MFEKLEDLESAEELMMVQDIIKNLSKISRFSNDFSLNRALVFCDDSSFIELLLSDEHYMLVFGAFECNTSHFSAKR